MVSKYIQTKKEKKQEYDHKWFKNLSEDQTQRLVEYRKVCFEKLISKNTSQWSPHLLVLFAA